MLLLREYRSEKRKQFHWTHTLEIALAIFCYFASAFLLQQSVAVRVLAKS